MHDNLKKTRITKGFTQDVMAKKLNISRPTYTRYETGERKPDYETIKKIAVILDISIDVLLGNDSNNEINNIGESIYAKLVEIGFLNNGEEVTDKHLEVLTKIIAPQLDYAKFQLEMKELEKQDNNEG